MRRTHAKALYFILSFIILVSLPMFVPVSWSYPIFLYLIFTAVAQMWNLLAGYGGMAFLGTSGMMGLPASLFALLLYQGIQWPLGLVIVIVISSAFYCLVGFPLLRMRGIYFGIASLMVSEILRTFFIVWDPYPELVGVGDGAGYPIRAYVPFYYIYLLSIVIGFASIAVTMMVLRSKMGLLVMGICDDEDQAEALGVNTFRAKLILLVLSSAITAFASMVYYMYQGAVQPNSAFGIGWLMIVILSVVIGGIRTIIGPLIGSAIMTAFTLIMPGFEEYSLLMQGIMLFAIMMVAPGGLVEAIKKVRKSV
jgi:branched-chain amino acid transport system permease protein